MLRWLFRRKGSNCASSYKAGKVVLYGANSPVGQKLSLLLKLSPHISEVVCCSTAIDELYIAQNSIRHVHRSASSLSNDLQWIDTDAVIESISRNKPEQWKKVLHDAQVALICPGQNFDLQRSDRDAALEFIAPVVQPFVEAIASAAPHVVIGVISEPVNALTALCAEWLKAHGAYDPRKLFGLTSLDTVRARNLVSETLQMNPFDITLSVVGGRGAGVSLPLLAQSKLRLPLGSAEYITEVLMSKYKGQPLKKIDTHSNSTALTAYEEEMKSYERAWAKEEEEDQHREQEQDEHRSEETCQRLLHDQIQKNKEESLQMINHHCNNGDSKNVKSKCASKSESERVSSSSESESLSENNEIHKCNENHDRKDGKLENATEQIRERSKYAKENSNSNVEHDSTSSNTENDNYSGSSSSSSSSSRSNNSDDDEEEIVPCPENTCASDMAVSCASYDFVISVLKAMRGDLGICECALTELPLYDNAPFFAAKVLLGRAGVERVIMHNELSQYEKTILHEAVLPELSADVQAGANFYLKSKPR